MNPTQIFLAVALAALSPHALSQTAPTNEPLSVGESSKKLPLSAEQARMLVKRAEDGDRSAFSDLLSDINEFENPWSLNALAYIDSRGVIGEKNPERAFHWLSKAASLGNSLAIANLGNLYERGEGVEKDLTKAKGLYEQSADMGNAVGQSRLGALYLDGVGVEKDIGKAIALLKKSADQNDGLGATLLALAYWGQLDGREHRASELAGLFRLGADQGIARAQELLAGFYLEGAGVPQDNSEAFRLFSDAAQQGSAKGMVGAARMIEQGTSGQRFDLDKVVGLYRQAANLGNSDAKESLVRLAPRIELEEQKRAEREKAHEAKRLAEEAAKPWNPSQVSSPDVQKAATRTVTTNDKGNSVFEYSDQTAKYGFEHLQHRGLIAFLVENRSDRTIALDPRMIVVTTERGATSPCSFSHASLFGMTPAGIGASVKPRSKSLFLLAGCATKQPYLVKDRVKSVSIDGLVVKR